MKVFFLFRPCHILQVSSAEAKPSSTNNSPFIPAICDVTALGIRQEEECQRDAVEGRNGEISAAEWQTSNELTGKAHVLLHYQAAAWGFSTSWLFKSVFAPKHLKMSEGPMWAIFIRHGSKLGCQEERTTCDISDVLYPLPLSPRCCWELQGSSACPEALRLWSWPRDVQNHLYLAALFPPTLISKPFEWP